MATNKHTTQRLNGTRDLSPREARRLAIIQTRLETFLDRRGYEVVSTPIMEATDLFLRKSGGELAAKMYSFTDPGGRKVSLRPEFTSSIVRAYVDGSFEAQVPVRLQYCGTVFRHESGHLGPREFYQFGAELIGAGGVAADAESIAFAVQGINALGVGGHRLRISHIGLVNDLFVALEISHRARVFLMGQLAEMGKATNGLEAIRGKAAEMGILREQGRGDLTRLAQSLESADAKEMVEGLLGDAVGGAMGQRTRDEVVFRYLRKLREAEKPPLIERAIQFAQDLVAIAEPFPRALPQLRTLLNKYSLDVALLGPLEELERDLSAYDLGDVPVTVDFALARGIAYYTGPIFEIEHGKGKSVASLGGGGRYDGLVKALGGASDVPALGFAYSIELLSELLPPEFGDEEDDLATRVLVVAAEATMEQAVATAERLRQQGIPAELDIVSRTEADASSYAQRRGITTIMRVGSDGSNEEQEL
jgi:histidyl-tRNA synthetase